jgi:hypothetical protein
MPNGLSRLQRENDFNFCFVAIALGLVFFGTKLSSSGAGSRICSLISPKSLRGAAPAVVRRPLSYQPREFSSGMFYCLTISGNLEPGVSWSELKTVSLYCFWCSVDVSTKVPSGALCRPPTVKLAP